MNELKDLRAKLHRTQAEMATLVGVTKLTWGRWERGEFTPLPVYRIKLAKLLAFVGRTKEEK
jgi:DNA-binding XRE family transcriptional regulator